MEKQPQPSDKFWVYKLPEVRAVLEPDSVMSTRLRQVDILDEAVAAEPDNEALARNRDAVRDMLEESVREGFPQFVPQEPEG
jgi:hypothetical protein